MPSSQTSLPESHTKSAHDRLEYQQQQQQTFLIGKGCCAFWELLEEKAAMHGTNQLVRSFWGSVSFAVWIVGGTTGNNEHLRHS
ncbi:hypothetical protein COCON_G00190980 [Conger conger]|uniref:Uncharacterized protein n=1 Tax=Conger conger TaxID=82655 RepID=A0A9Q1D3I9_CONCO|nr:hypothetical protein COCON_G00190980 [Conger conger]